MSSGGSGGHEGGSSGAVQQITPELQLIKLQYTNAQLLWDDIALREFPNYVIPLEEVGLWTTVAKYGKVIDRISMFLDGNITTRQLAADVLGGRIR